MILSREDLKDCIASDNDFLQPLNLKEKLIALYACYPDRNLKKYVKFLRKQEYYINTAGGNKIKGFLSLYFERRKNRLGNRMGIEIPPNCFGPGLKVWHANIVININTSIGKNCTLHGANCIGNNGLTETAPIIGNNVDIGYGAVIIGGITIADGVKIGANAVVNRSFLEPGVTIAGSPAKIVNRPESHVENTP